MLKNKIESFFGLLLILIVLFKTIYSLSHKFKKHDGLSISDKEMSLSFIASTRGESKIKCITTCAFDNTCLIVTYYQNKTCMMYKKTAKDYLIRTKTDDVIFFVKQECHPIGFKTNYTTGMTNYWTLGHSLKDLVGGKDLILKINAAVTSDRLGNRNSAIEFNLGYGEFPAGKYFNPIGYTFMVWMKAVSYNNHQCIIGFSNGIMMDNIGIGFFSTDTKLRSWLYAGSTEQASPLSNNIPLAEWVHVAMTSSNNEVSLYVSGVKQFTYTARINDVERAQNFIGKSAWDGNSKVHAVFNEMKIFNRALSIEEIVVEKEKKKEIVYGHLLYVLSMIELFTEGLIHYWPIAGSTKDIVGGSHMVIVKDGELIDDQYGNKESAVVFNFGYGEFPSGKYFNPLGFTIMMWIKVLSLKTDLRIIDFSNGAANDNIFISVISKDIKIKSYSYLGSTYQGSQLSKVISLAEWIHVAVTSSDNEVSLYLNSVKEATYTGIINDAVRTQNNIGKSAWDGDPYAHAIFDEMKIFNRALSMEEISIEKEKKQPYEILHN